MTKRKFMAEAYELAKLGQYSTKTGVNVGCVIVKNNKILSRGWYEKYGGAHAEINAVFCLKKKYPKSFESVLSQSSIYVSLEPCSKTGKTPPCVDELKKYDFKEIIIGHEDTTQNGIQELSKSGFKISQVRQKSLEINQGFFKAIHTNKPYIRAKIAMSKDGKTSFKNKKNKWITSLASRNDAQHYRAISDLIITGGGTLVNDNPSLNVRNKRIIKYKGFSQPDKAVITNASLDFKKFKFFQDKSKKLIFTSKKNNIASLKLSNTEIKNIQTNGSNSDLNDLVSCLTEMNYKDVLIEAGPNLLTSFINANLIDEFIIYISPKILSNTANYFFNGKNSLNPMLSKKYEKIESKKIGADKKIILRKRQKWD